MNINVVTHKLINYIVINRIMYYITILNYAIILKIQILVVYRFRNLGIVISSCDLRIGLYQIILI